MRKLFITAFGLGYLPVAPGTWGSAGAVGVWACAAWAVVTTQAASWWLDVPIVAGIVLACAASVIWGEWAVEFFKSKDPKPFVLDEVAGQWTALLLLPVASTGTLLTVGATQFFLFRVFDIIKPPPARQLERLPAGWGVLLDDIAAGLYANIIGQVIFRLIWGSP